MVSTPHSPGASVKKGCQIFHLHQRHPPSPPEKPQSHKGLISKTSARFRCSVLKQLQASLFYSGMTPMTCRKQFQLQPAQEDLNWIPCALRPCHPSKGPREPRRTPSLYQPQKGKPHVRGRVAFQLFWAIAGYSPVLYSPSARGEAVRIGPKAFPA